MNLTVLLLAVALALGSAKSPAGSLLFDTPRPPVVNNVIKNVDVDLCPTCIRFTEKALNILLNIIVQAGIEGSCGKLCSALADKTGSQVLGGICMVLCEVGGVKEFVKLIEKADLDPIYFCELLKRCPINDHGDAQITDLAIDPVTGPRGQRSITFTIQSKNGTGTGEMIITVKTVDGIPVQEGLLMQAASASQFPAPQKFTLKAEPDPSCDPTQQFCEQWVPGTYVLRVEICNGECGSKHPHSQLYDRKETNFTITQ